MYVAITAKQDLADDRHRYVRVKTKAFIWSYESSLPMCLHPHQGRLLFLQTLSALKLQKAQSRILYKRIHFGYYHRLAQLHNHRLPRRNSLLIASRNK